MEIKLPAAHSQTGCRGIERAAGRDPRVGRAVRVPSAEIQRMLDAGFVPAEPQDKATWQTQ